MNTVKKIRYLKCGAVWNAHRPLWERVTKLDGIPPQILQHDLTFEPIIKIILLYVHNILAKHKKANLPARATSCGKWLASLGSIEKQNHDF